MQNRLVSATSPTTTDIAYAYDAFGRRVGKTVDGVETTYLYSGDDVIAEYDGAGDLLRRFVWGPRIDEPVAMVLANGDRFYHHADALGSIIALTDDAGTMTESYGYLPFGEVRADGATPYRFTGRRYDPETGVYYYRNRYYDPWQGRFISRDPLGVTVDVNLYRYVGNDPVNFVDPYGLAAFYIEFIGYNVQVDSTDTKAPLGHGGVITVDNKTGETKYRDYGRYGDQNGRVRDNVRIRNVEIGSDGKPTQKSVEIMMADVSERLGKGAPVYGQFFPGADANKILAHIDRQKNNPNRPNYNPLTNNCYNFARNAISAGYDSKFNEILDLLNSRIKIYGGSEGG